MYSQQQNKDPKYIELEKIRSEVSKIKQERELVIRRVQILSIPAVDQLTPKDKEETLQVGVKLLDCLNVGQVARIVENGFQENT